MAERRKQLVIDKSRFSVKLYRERTDGNPKWELVKRYPCSIAATGYRTPKGTYTCQYKEKNPAWTKPASDWVPEDEWGDVVPGGDPENPLVYAWIGIDGPGGRGLHGTKAEDSMGTRASHGCVRMLPDDIKDLFPRVPIGTPIVIT